MSADIVALIDQTRALVDAGGVSGVVVAVFSAGGASTITAVGNVTPANVERLTEGRTQMMALIERQGSKT
jgi:hypothetical protein